MAVTRDFLLEEIKHLLDDVGDFLSNTLKKEKLKKEVGAKRDELAQQIIAVVTKVEKILPKEEQEEYADVEVDPNAAEEDGELYEDTVTPIPDSPNKNVMSQGSDRDVPDEPEPPEASERDDNGDAYGDMKIGPIAATDIVKPVMEGYLEKRRKEGQLGLQLWQKRYCVIKDNIFYYFKNRNDKQQKNVILLTGYEARPNPDYDKKHKKRDFLFEVVCPAKRSFQFIAQSAEEMKTWTDAIAAASKVVSAVESSTKSTPDAVGGSPAKEFNDREQEIPDDCGETYEDVDTYQKSAVAKPVGDGAPNSESGSMIYDDTEAQQIDTDEVYEDVSGKEPEVPQRPPVRTGGLPEVPQPFKLPPVSVQHRPRPEPPIKLEEKERPAVLKRGSFNKPDMPTSVAATQDPHSSPAMPPKPEPWEEDYENIYMGMWDCVADDDNELEFNRGDLVHILSKEYDSFNWWVGEKNSKVGLVPKDYLMVAYLL